ncbi:MAG TPA: hypothetical protein VIL16_12520 [Trebonia sp.]
MSLVNLTLYPVAIYGNRPVEDGPGEVIPPSGKVARVATIELGTGLSNHSGRSYELVEYGHVHDLPQPEPGTDYIVSLVVALACHRDDLLAPFVEVRNEQGTMIGCRYLQRVC